MNFNLSGSDQQELIVPSRDEIIKEVGQVKVLFIGPGYEYVQDLALYFSSIGIPEKNVVDCLHHIDYPDESISADLIVLTNNEISAEDERFHPGSDDIPRIRCISEIKKWFIDNKAKLSAIPCLQVDFYEQIIYQLHFDEQPEKIKKARNIILHFYKNFAGNFYDELGFRVKDLGFMPSEYMHLRVV